MTLQTWTLLRTLTASELTNVRRDSLLRWVAAMPVIMAVSLRWLVPVVDANIRLDLRPYSLLILSGQCIVAVPLLVGFVVGMMLLDERDDGTLQAMRVTSLSLGGYLFFKLTLPVLAATVLTILCIPLTGLMELRAELVPACFVGSLWAPVVAMFMASFAGNKLQGIVIMRLSGIPVAAPMLAWFFERMPLFWLMPGYWPLKAFWLAGEGRTYWPFIWVGAIAQLACLGWLARHFRRVINRS